MKQRLDYMRVSPDGMKTVEATLHYVRECGLNAMLVDLVFLRISQINACAYCIDVHTRDLTKHGISPEKLSLLPVWAEVPELFTVQEYAALGWAETVTNLSVTHVPDAAYQAAAAAFDAKTLTDLTIAIGVMNTFNRMGVAFRAVPPSVRHAPVQPTAINA